MTARRWRPRGRRRKSARRWAYRSGLGYLKSCRVAYGLLTEVAADPRGRLCQPTHVADCGLLELLLAAHRRLAHDVLLEISIQPFIWVEFRTVGRQVEDLDLRLVPAQPLLHHRRAMHRQPIQDQEHFAPGIADQALQEIDQHRRLDRAIEHLPA